MKTVSFYTLGCKVNQYETEAMTEMFRGRGYTVVDFSDVSDVYVINTCSVTSMSDRKSRQIIHRAKKQNPNGVIIVAGCYAQTAPDTVLAIDGVNLVIGTQNRKNIVDEAERLTELDKKSIVGDISCCHEFEEMKISDYDNMTRAYIKIQEGCNQFCTYCIIPYARGPIRSRAPEEVLSEVKTLAADGFSEIILVGIHIASYGLDLKSTSLSDIILAVNDVEGIKRIRLSSIEPMTLSTAFIEKLRPAHKLCPHFHLSLQSGCDETLRRMNRRYTTAQYAEIVRSVRENFKDAAITTDIMVGFPGETEEEFEKSAEFAKQMCFSDMHIFQYSERPGTPAADFPNRISPSVKEQRSKLLERIKKENKTEFLKRFVGKEIDVLFEHEVHGKSGVFEGKSANYITVRVKTDKNLSFKYGKVLITKLDNDGVFGELSED